VERARRILGSDDPALYAALNDLGTVYETMDRGTDAVRVVTESLEGRRRLLGEKDGLVLATMSHLALAYDRAGDTQKALSLDLEALRFAETLADPPRMTMIELCNNIGATYQDLNRDAEAEPYLRRAAGLAETWIGPDNPATLTLQANLAGLESKLGDPAKGRQILERVVAVRTKLLGQDASDTLTARYAFWDTYRFEKRYREAAAGYLPLLADIERALGAKHWLATQTRAMLGTILLADGRAAEALPYAERATEEFLALYGPDHPRTRNTTILLQNVRKTLAKATADGQPAAAP
jgi:tetratricopeptide (TPR) repeat protein